MKICPLVPLAFLVLASLPALVASHDETKSQNVLEDDVGDVTTDGLRGSRVLNNANPSCHIVNANGNGKAKPCTETEKTRRRPTKYIVGGQPVTSDDQYREAIGLIQVASTDSSGNPTSVYRDPFCSGTLISDKVVLTAAHCLVWSGKKAVSPDEIAIYVGRNTADDAGVSTALYFSRLVAVQEVLAHPNYRSSGFSDDIALIRLKETAKYYDGSIVSPVPALPSSMEITSADYPPSGSTGLYFVGFGVGGTNGDSTVSKQYVGPIPLSGLTSDPGIWYEQGAGGPCSGDSGGGTYVSESGTMYNAGVVSYGDRYCTSYGVSTKVDEFDAWITAFIDGTGGGGGGDGGGGDGSCGSCGGTKSAGTKCRGDGQCCSCDCANIGSNGFGKCF